MLRISHLKKTFFGRKDFLAVKDISLTVEKGEVFGLLGPNAAGKTTVIKLITGLLKPNGGRITINNLPSASAAAKQITGVLPEQPQFYRYLKTKELLDLAGGLFGLDRLAASLRSVELAHRVGLGNDLGRLIGQFSKGMHQRLGLAVALVNDPFLLILDEPLDGLDPIGRADFKKLILELKSRGKTIFFSSHILSDVAEICDRVAIINRGRLLKIGSLSEITANQLTLEEAFVQEINNDNRA